MVINSKILSIPPYISTSWNHIMSIHLDTQNVLVIALKNGLGIGIPHLPGETIQAIFSAHAQYLEKEENTSFPDILPKEISLALKGGLLDMTTVFLEHDASKASSPDLPQDILDKLSQISQKMGPIDPDKMPQAEPHCNCPHCQIVRAAGQTAPEKNERVEQAEELVSEEDLHFHDWDITQIDNTLYTVTNPIDPIEKYTVFLGNPVGCTCGDRNCEHIKAVLHS